MILDLHRQGLSVSAIARRSAAIPRPCANTSSVAWNCRPTVRGSHALGASTRSSRYLRERVAAFPDLTGRRLFRELRERGYGGAYTAVKRFATAAARGAAVRGPLRDAAGPPGAGRLRPLRQVAFDGRAGRHAGSSGCSRWCSAISRHILARFVLHQDLQTLLRCHMAAFAAIGGVPIEILYDRMKTAVTGEDGQGHIVYNRSLLALAQHYGFHPQRLPALSGQDEGQGRATLQLHPPGLLPRPHVPQSRRSERPAAGLARLRSPTSACTARPSGSSRRPSLPSSPSCSPCHATASTRCSSSNAASAMRAGLDRRQLLQRSRSHPACRRGASACRI